MENQEKNDYYLKRTYEHIRRVQANVYYLLTHCGNDFMMTDDEKRILMWNALIHDSTKFSDEQYSAYAEFSWHKKNGTELINEQQEAFDIACLDHYQIENHHPERFENRQGMMTSMEIIEMACDLQAMADEFGEGDFEKYYETVWKRSHIKYFNDYQWGQVVKYMDRCLRCFKAKVSKSDNK